MATKSEYSETFNKIFGTSIDWTKLSKEELAQLATSLSNPEMIMKKLGYGKKENNKKDDIVEKAGELIDTLIDRLRNNINTEELVDEISDRIVSGLERLLSSHEGPIIKKVKEKIKR